MVMMIMIEYVNVASAGRWFGRLQDSPLRQVAAGALLGLIPGCIGGFAAVSLYSHGVISMGALVAAMISSSGDESFVMLAMIPRQALVLFAVLFVLAIVCGLLTDLMFRKHPLRVHCDPGFELHDANKGEFPNIFRLSSYRVMRGSGKERIVLMVAILIFVAAVFSGFLEHEHVGGEAAEVPSAIPFNFLSERWMNILFAILSIFVVLLVAASSEHFAEGQYLLSFDSGGPCRYDSRVRPPHGVHLSVCGRLRAVLRVVDEFHVPGRPYLSPPAGLQYAQFSYCKDYQCPFCHSYWQCLLHSRPLADECSDAACRLNAD